MSRTSFVFDLQALEGAEHGLREQLRTHPENMDLRLRLAWCLFMEALHRAGQEAAMHPLLASRDADRDTDSVSSVVLERNAQGMLADCLEQAYTVLHLSDQAEVRNDVAKIQALVQLSGAHPIAMQQEAQAMRHFTDLFEALCCPKEIESTGE